MSSLLVRHDLAKGKYRTTILASKLSDATPGCRGAASIKFAEWTSSVSYQRTPAEVRFDQGRRTRRGLHSGTPGRDGTCDDAPLRWHLLAPVRVIDTVTSQYQGQ
jgi:hypothetical protein